MSIFGGCFYKLYWNQSKSLRKRLIQKFGKYLSSTALQEHCVRKSRNLWRKIVGKGRVAIVAIRKGKFKSGFPKQIACSNAMFPWEVIALWFSVSNIYLWSFHGFCRFCSHLWAIALLFFYCILMTLIKPKAWTFTPIDSSVGSYIHKGLVELKQ